MSVKTLRLVAFACLVTAIAFSTLFAAEPDDPAEAAEHGTFRINLPCIFNSPFHSPLPTPTTPYGIYLPYVSREGGY